VTGHAIAYWVLGKGVFANLGRLLSDFHHYGAERVPRAGGAVLAMSHFSYFDPVAYGISSPRRIVFMAKAEAHRMPVLGQLIRSHGTLAVRRGESDRDAIRLARQAVRDNHLLGMFIEGTRQRKGEPGEPKPGAAMIAMHEGVPIVPAAILGSHDWNWNFAPVSVAWGEPMRFDETPLTSKGYRAATAEVHGEILRLYRFLQDMHALGDPPGRPPLRAHVPFKLGEP
jgi:1-acyl-sn-glycerol-3-phosphate acyltransferase